VDFPDHVWILEDLSWKPKTISVVLPCAGEGLFAKKFLGRQAAWNGCHRNLT
jgi:hypothetical protein